MHNLRFFIVVCFLLLSACSSTTSQTVSVGPVDLAQLPAEVDAATVASIKEQPEVFVLDVREVDEYTAGHIPGVTHIPMNDVPARLEEIPTDKTVIVTCRSGNRSSQITTFLQDQGYTNIHNMQGGILAWQEAGYPVER
ncbi:MAG: rhodanese-like domain-containing protein [Chloroflexi bacterium AL-W]|nr:rhodanese-like domain-containing protein [Chloroflexi bacterium AL-N1]NOK69371.1 rhodanese-like domain-containing protein [Chloroflexi bacterium AL-N10]NOK76432.1 rhodanese-like domain-containing protein [Chloroflexi bacterium AL-N5]NOK83549.1 rhodanese-like domain-containing protein [Chloroflexi bacterium AL-W]NOK91209.1 rhodanese-like domain-containing protein [Chloroflexi bacterium AL-N15]